MNNVEHPFKPIQRNTWVCIFTSFFCSTILMGCVYTQPQFPSTQVSYEQNTPLDSTVSSGNEDVLLDSAPDSMIGNTSSQLSRKELLNMEAEHWFGTPHRLGGNSESGVDCSALVQNIYNKLFETSIPRTTREQVRIGARISPSKLQVGDLVFYRINLRSRHVGIYVGDNSFLHASKSEGVAISSLDTPYWKSRFWMARRILPPEDHHEERSLDPKKVEITW